jgi:hypothetical protein
LRGARDWHSTKVAVFLLDHAFPSDVVFDFDNTIIQGDIGEATMAVLLRWGLLSSKTVPANACPAFRHSSGRKVDLNSCADLAEYYEWFLEPTVHGSRDRAPLSNAYSWVVQLMQGLTPWDVIRATRAAFEWSEPANPQVIEVTPGKTSFPVPVFYREVVDLIVELIRHKFEIWIVSASNVWSVRWMVLNALNPLLRHRGAEVGLRPERVIGTSTLLVDAQGYLYKDPILVRENKGYASLKEGILKRLRLTGQVNFPLPTYSGKSAVILDSLGQSPYLAVGDSPGDLPMLAMSRYRLWIGRLEKPEYQKLAAQMVLKTGARDWFIQPTWATRSMGFVQTLNEIASRISPIPTEIMRSVRILSRLQLPNAKARRTRVNSTASPIAATKRSNFEFKAPSL